MWKKKKKIVLFEAFSWIWSQHKALKNLWFDVSIAGISDWYVDAIIAYALKHLSIKPKKINKKKIIEELKNYSLSLNSKTEAKNISNLSDEKLSIIHQVIKIYWDLNIKNIKWEDLLDKNIDLFTYSFPCQDISQQWKQKGFSKGKETRSGLLWEVERVLKEIHKYNKKSLPKVLMMENVKALLNVNFKEDIDSWIKELKKLWYESTKLFIVNSADLWEVQRRERVFLISKLWNEKLKKFEINNSKNRNHKYLRDIFEDKLLHEEFKTDKKIKIKKLKNPKGIKKSFLEWYTNFNAENYVYFKDWKSPTITASWAQSRIKIFHEDKIVYLNWYEHLKLQWFEDKKFYDDLKEIWLTENKIKFLAGNSINVSVLKEIFNFYL